MLLLRVVGLQPGVGEAGAAGFSATDAGGDPRSAGALVVVLIGVRIRSLDVFRRDGTLTAGVFTGLLFALEFVFINIGLTFTTASRAIIFLYTTPFFVSLGASALRRRLAQWAGWRCRSAASSPRSAFRRLTSTAV